MSVHPQKECVFLKEEIDFLGILIWNNVNDETPEKVKVLQNVSKSKSITRVRSFLGLYLFFRRFVLNLSKISTQLTVLTKKGLGIHTLNDSFSKSFRMPKSL